MKQEELQYFEHLCDLFLGPSSGMEKQKAGDEIANIIKRPGFLNDIE